MFTHLHLHTDFSLLDSVIQLPQLLEKLQKSNMNSCAITDHGNLYGAFKFHSMLKKNGMKPIIGCEVYVSPRSMLSKEHGIDNKYYHLVLLAKNLVGYKNLVKIVSTAHMEGFYYKPRIDFETLSKYTEGIIASSACLRGVLSYPILEGNEKLLEENLNKYSQAFKDNFYIEIQRNGIPEIGPVNERLLKIAKDNSLPIIATCDSHFVERADSQLQEVLWAIRDGKTLDDPTRAKLSSDDFYVKTPEEMTELFKDLPEAVENTQKIADMCEDYDLSFGRVDPVYKNLPTGKTSKEHLKDIVFEGAERRYGGISEELKQRLNYELEVIDDKKYNDYFLIVRDFIKFCHNNGIVVGIRGSACGSAIAYSAEITHVEPISWELYFERFLNPERKSPPDIDIDIADADRDKVINYALEIFGEDSVKQIGTFSKLQTRQAIRDISRVLNIDLSIANRLSKMVVIEFGKAKPLDYMIEHDKEFADIINSSSEMLRMADMVRKLNGIHRGVSTHACGVIITPEPVVEYAPIQRDAHGGGMGMTQYEMSDTEEIGLMKYDFLGLRNLSVIGKTLNMIKRSRGEEVDLFSLDTHDKKAYELIQQGHTVGVFQMEGEGMKKVVRSLKPESLEEISYVLAAYRPGPLQFIPEYISVKNGEKQPEYLFPELEPILSVTNGVITYQEQVIRIAVDIAGYTMGSADQLRKAMGKKKMDVMEQEKPKFIEGAVAKGFDKAKVEQIWDKLLQFANYGFNKAHSASYAYVTFWTAYLKSHYPIEFMSSLLESDLSNFNRVVIDMEECKRLGIKVLPPHINKSDFYFKLEEEKNVRFGLAGVKNVGEEVVREIILERNDEGEFLNFDDFIYRVISRGVTVKAIEYLVMTGAMDHWGQREALIAVLPTLFDKYKKQHQIEKEGQFDMFTRVTEIGRHIETASVLPKVEVASAFQKLQWEKELLGLYMSSHPLDEFEEFFAEKNVVPISSLKERQEGEVVILGGTITKVRRITTKSNQNMAFVTLEDKTGTIDLILFPRNYEDLKNELQPDVPVLCAGRVNFRGEDISVIAEKLKVIDLTKINGKFDGVVFRVREQHAKDEIADLKKAIVDNPGDMPVKILMYSDDTVKSVVLKYKITLNESMEVYVKRFA